MFIAMLKTTDGYKRNLCIAYDKYAKFYNIAWNMPKYKPEAKNIALPTKEKIQMLIASAGKLLGMKLQLSMETGLRPVELARLKVKDLDLDHKTVNPTTAKKGNARTLPLDETLTAKLKEHIANHNLAPTDLLFKGTDSDHYGKQYRDMRNKLAANDALWFLYEGIPFVIISQTRSGFLEEKTKALPALGVTSTASANEVVYAIEPSYPYLTPTPRYLPKAFVFLQETISLSKNDLLLSNP